MKVLKLNVMLCCLACLQGCEESVVEDQNWQILSPAAEAVILQSSTVNVTGIGTGSTGNNLALINPRDNVIVGDTISFSTNAAGNWSTNLVVAAMEDGFHFLATGNPHPAINGIGISDHSKKRVTVSGATVGMPGMPG